MKTRALIIAAMITGTAFSTTAMAQQGGIGGKFNLKTTVNLYGKVDLKRNAIAHFGNVKLKNSRIGGNADLTLHSEVNGPVLVEKGGRLGHGTLGMYNSQITGNVTANLKAISKKITVGQDAKVFVASVDMYGQSKINGSLDITAVGNTGEIKTEKESTLLVSSLQMKGSTINGNAKLNLKSKVGKITLGQRAKADISSVSMMDSTVGGPMNVTSQVQLHNVNLGKDARFAAGAIVLNNANISGGVDFNSNVSVSENIELASGADLGIGSLQIM